MSAGLLVLFLAVVLFAHPLADGLAEVLTRIELRWIGGDWPWTP